MIPGNLASYRPRGTFLEHARRHRKWTREGALLHQGKREPPPMTVMGTALRAEGTVHIGHCQVCEVEDLKILVKYAGWVGQEEVLFQELKFFVP